MISQSALKRGLIDPQIQKARRAKMQQMAAKAYAAKVSSKQMPYVHTMYQVYHNEFWKKHDEKFINELKSRNDSLNISNIPKKSSVASSNLSMNQELAMLDIDDKNEGLDQSNISKEMKKKKVDFGQEQNYQSEMKLMNKKKEQEIKNAFQAKRRQEIIEMQIKIKQEELKRLQRQKQIRQAKQKQEREELKRRKQQQQKEQKQQKQREAALQHQKILQKNREQQRLKRQAQQTRKINEKIELQKKKIKQIEQIQKAKQQQQQQEQQQEVQEQCGPSYYQTWSNASNFSKIKNDEIGDSNAPTIHSSMIVKSEPKQEVNFLSSLRQDKSQKEIKVPSSWMQEKANANARKESNQNIGNLVQSNKSNRSQDYRKSITNLQKSEVNIQKNSYEVGLQDSIKVDRAKAYQPIIKQQIQQKIVGQNQLQVYNVDSSNLMIELDEPTTYLDEKRQAIDQLNEQKDTSAILAQLNTQPQKNQDLSDKIVENVQILSQLQQKPKIQSSYSLQQFRIDSRSIDNFSRPSLKIVQQPKQTKDKIRQIIVEEEINPSVLISQSVQQQNIIGQSYDQSKTFNADDTIQQINIEEKIDAIIYDFLLNIDQKNGLCPECSSHKVKHQSLIKKIEDLQQKNSQLIHSQQELIKKSRQNTINFETKMLSLQNQKESLMQKLESQPFYMVNPGIKGQKRKNSQSCLPQKSTQNRKDYNSEQESGKNSSDNQGNERNQGNEEEESGKNSSDYQQNQRKVKQQSYSKNEKSQSQQQQSD